MADAHGDAAALAKKIRASSINLGKGAEKLLPISASIGGHQLVCGVPNSTGTSPRSSVGLLTRNNASVGSLSVAGGVAASVRLRMSEDRALKQRLKSASVMLGTNREKVQTGYLQSFIPFSAEQRLQAQGAQDPAVKAELQKVHFSFGSETQKDPTFNRFITDQETLSRSHYDPHRMAADTWYAAKYKSSELKGLSSEAFLTSRHILQRSKSHASILGQSGTRGSM